MMIRVPVPYSKVPILLGGIFGVLVFLSVLRAAGHPYIARQAADILGQKRPQYARQVSAAELMARPPPGDVAGIPKILHQSWKSLDLPPKFEKWSMTCREKHRDWDWVVWTDEDNLELVRRYFPWLESSYRALPSEIYRADLVRHLYMYSFGG